MNQMLDDPRLNLMAVVPGNTEERFAEIASELRPHIFRFLLSSLRDPDLAETMTQECFLKAHRSWRSFRHNASVRTWLISIAINLQKDHWRSRRTQFWKSVGANSIDADDLRDWLPDRRSSPESQVAAREQVALLWCVVERLTERQRTILLLRLADDMNLSEIAAATGLSDGTVKAHLSRALKKVRTEFKRRLGQKTLQSAKMEFPFQAVA